MSSDLILLRVITAAMSAHVTPLLMGDPGVGKSSLAHTLAEADGGRAEVVLGSLREASDFNGLPVVGADGVFLEAPAWAKRLASGESTHLLLDEVTTVPAHVRKAMLGVILDRTVGDLHLPDSVRILAAANPASIAVDGDDLDAPLANRFLHLDYVPSTDAWIEGMTAGWRVPALDGLVEPTRERKVIARSHVAAFIRHRPDLLHKLPTDAAAAAGPWPSRRTWTMTADVLAALTPCPSDPTGEDAEFLAVTGLVGEGAGTEFLTWRRLNDLPDPADVLAAPGDVDWQSLDPSRAWAILAGVIALCTGRRTATAWREAWKPLATAAESGLGDVAAAHAVVLMRARPATATPPREVRKFTTVLSDAGVLTPTTAAAPASAQQSGSAA
jgi:MoxR-like ATPase